MKYLLTIILMNMLSAEPAQVTELNATLPECIASAAAILKATANSNMPLKVSCDLAKVADKPPEPDKPKTEERSF